jgi:hypothetical protein
MSLAISLLEYGFAWKHLDPPDEDGDDYLIIYRLSDRAGYIFERCGACSDNDLAKEHNWIRWDEFLSTTGHTREEWDKLPYPIRVYDLVNHYGYENIFGSSYWEGFKITKPAWT